MQPTPIVHADSSLLVWLIVVVITMVSQLVKASRQRPRIGEPPPIPPRRPPRAPMPERDARQELEEFLATLTGQAPPQEGRQPPLFEFEREGTEEEEVEERKPAYAPPPPPPPPHPSRRPQPVERRQAPLKAASRPAPARRQERVAAPPKPVAVAPVDIPPAPEPVRPARTDHYEIATRMAVQRPSQASAIRAALLQQLAGTTGKRSAVLMREILDGPVSMRRQPGIPGLGA